MSLYVTASQCRSLQVTESHCKAENPFIRMRNVCVTYAAYKYATVNTFSALKEFAVVQLGRDVNLII